MKLTLLFIVVLGLLVATAGTAWLAGPIPVIAGGLVIAAVGLLLDMGDRS